MGVPFHRRACTWTRLSLTPPHLILCLAVIIVIPILQRLTPSPRKVKVAKHHTVCGSSSLSSKLSKADAHPAWWAAFSAGVKWQSGSKQGLDLPAKAVLCSPRTSDSYWLAENLSFFICRRRVIIRGSSSWACCQD